MSAKERIHTTTLATAHFDAEQVVSYRANGAGSVHPIYCVAQQAMLGEWFAFRNMEGAISIPYLEFVELGQLHDPTKDGLARKAADWLQRNAKRSNDGVVWLNDFEFVHEPGTSPLKAPWPSGIGQANALLACLHWWKFTQDGAWRELAERAVAPFTRNFNELNGFAREMGEHAIWFEEYPGLPVSSLATHLLCLYALQQAAKLLDSDTAKKSLERGLRGLQQSLRRYDLGDWSRQNLSNQLFLLLRLVPSELGTVALSNVRIASITKDVAVLIASNCEPCDEPVSRLAGIDWGVVQNIDTQNGRMLSNRQSVHAGRVPEGGTDQNTYLVFEEQVAAHQWIENGLKLSVEAFTGDGGALTIEFRDLRQENLAFRSDDTSAWLRGDDWETHEIKVPARLIGRPIPRNIHRFHTEALGTILDEFEDELLAETYERWHRSDLFDIPHSVTRTRSPLTIYSFVNDRCGLKCKMCDIGLANLGVDQEALLSVQTAMRPEGAVATMPMLKPSLALNMTDRARDLRPEILEEALRGLGENARGSLLQLNGTEPLLYPELPDILRTAKSMGMKTGVTTSGITLTREARKLAEAGLDQLLLSIDGPPEIHDEIRGVPKLFSRLLQGVAALDDACRELCRSRPEIIISFAVTLDNHRQILAFLEAVRPMQPASIILNHLNFVAPEVARSHTLAHPDYPIGPSSVPAWEDCRRMDFLELFRQIEIALRASWTRVSIIPYCPTPTRLKWYYDKPQLPMSRSRCAAPWASVQIRADGTVAVLARCFDLSLGDLNTKSIQEIWDGQAKQAFTEFVVDHPFMGPCLRCCGSL